MSNGHGIDCKSRVDSYYRLTDLPEVVNRQSGHPNLPEAVNRWSQNAPQVVSSDYPEVTTTKADLEADKYYVATNGKAPPSPTIPLTGEKAQKILGIPRRIFFITSLVFFVLFASGMFVVVALTTTRKNRIEPATDSSPTLPPLSPDSSVTIKPSSIKLADRPSIAATNYTLDDITRRYVFSQAGNHSLLVSLWDSKSLTWTTLDLSTILNATRPDLALSFIPNTPIAAYSYQNPAFQMRLYALVAGNSIRELVCTDPSLRKSWVPGRLGFETFLSTATGSKLAALRPQCGTGDDCRNRFPNMAVAYEDPTGQLMVAKSPKFQALKAPADAIPGAEIGLAAVMKNDTINDLRWHLLYRSKAAQVLNASDVAGILVGYTSEGSLEDFALPNYVGDGRLEAPGASLVAQRPNMCMATFSFDLVNVMVLIVPPATDIEFKTGRRVVVKVVGNLAGMHPFQRSGFLSVDETAPKGAIPENAMFDALSGTADRRVYGAIGGRIHEWQFDYTKALTSTSWRYMGPVS